MAVKIFCNACQKYIRTVTARELKSLSTDEVCLECQKKIKETYEEVDKIAKRGIIAIQGERDKIKAELKQAWDKVINFNEEK